MEAENTPERSPAVENPRLFRSAQSSADHWQKIRRNGRHDRRTAPTVFEESQTVTDVRDLATKLAF